MIKKFLILFLLLNISFCFAYPKQHPVPPFLIAKNLYYVGTDDLASYLITTPKGYILINSNLEEDIPLLKASIKKLGFQWGDIKILLTSHAHLDHAGGSHLIQQETKASYRVMAQDISVIETGGRSDFYYAQDPSMHFTPTVVDKVLHDGDTVSLGDTVLTAHLTAGHTKGCTTWTMPMKEDPKTKIVILCSLHVNSGYPLIHNASYPSIAMDYEKSFQYLKSLKGPILFLGPHTEIFNLSKKYSLLNTQKKNPFIDTQGYKQYLNEQEKEFYKELNHQKKEPVSS